MSVVYESDRMAVVDTREFLSLEQACDFLLAGRFITVCDPPDYGAESEWDIFPAPFRVSLRDVMGDDFENILFLSEAALRSEIMEYLRGYELSD